MSLFVADHECLSHLPESLCENLPDGETSLEVGLELECHFCDSSGAMIAPETGRNIRAECGSDISAELTESTAEINTGPYRIAPGVYHSLVGELSRKLGVVKRVAENNGSGVMLSGVPSYVQEEMILQMREEYRDPLCVKPSFMAYPRENPESYNLLWKQFRKWTDGLMGELVYPNFQEQVTLLEEGFTAGVHTNLKVPVSQWHRYRTTGLFVEAIKVGLSGSSPFYHGQVTGCQSSRIPLFEASVYLNRDIYQLSPGGIPIRKGRYGIEDELRAVLRADRPLLRPLPETDDPLTLMKAVLKSAHSGIRFRLEADHIREEQRCMDSNPVRTTVGLSLVSVAMMEVIFKKWPQGIEKAGFTYEDAVRNLRDAARHGKNTTIRVPGVPDGLLLKDFAESLIPDIQDVLMNDWGLGKQETGEVLEHLNASIRHYTLSEVMLEWYFQGATLPEINLMVAHYGTTCESVLDFPINLKLAKTQVVGV